MTVAGKAVLGVMLVMADGAQAADQVTAQQAIERYRETFPTTGELDCPKTEGGEIVVCARRDDKKRLPLPVEPDARARRGDTPLPSEHAQFDNSAACVSRKGCAKATIPIISTGRRAPGAPEPVVDTILGAISSILDD